MKMHRLLLTALLGGSVLAAGGFSDAHARRGAIKLSPLTNWTIAKVNRSGSTGDYCTMAKRFSNDLILTIARNTRDEASIAVDFQREVLNPGKIYTVILVSGDESRAFDVTPVSREAFVVRTGSDAAFYDSVAKFGYVDVNFSGKVYRFLVKDLNSGQGQLDACVASLVQPAAGNSVSSSGRGAAGDHVDDVPAGAGFSHEQENMALMREKIMALRSENTALSQELRRMRTEYESKVQSTAGRSVVSELNEKLNLLERENAALRKSVGEFQLVKATTASTKGRIDVLEQEISRLEENNERLGGRLAAGVVSADAATEELTRIRAEKTDLEQQNAELQSLLRQADQKNADSLEAVRRNLDSEIASLEGEKAHLEKELSKTQASLDRAMEQLTASAGDDATVNGLESRLSAVAKEKEELERQRNELQAMFEQSARENSGEVQAVRVELSKKIASLESENARLELVLGEARESLHSVRAALAEAAEGGQAASDLESRLSIMKGEKQSLELELEKLRGESLKISKLQSELSSLQNELAGEREVNADLRSQVDGLKLVISEADDSKEGELEIARLKDRISELEAENKELYGSFETAKMEIDHAGEADREALRLSEEKAASLGSQLDAAMRKNTELEELLRTARAAGDAARDNADVNSRIVADLRAEIDDLRSENSGLRNELSSARLRVSDTAEHEMEQQKIVIGQLHDRIEGLLDENDGLRESLKDMRRRVDSGIYADAGSSSMQYEIDALKAKLDAAEKANSRLNSEIEGYRISVSSAALTGDMTGDVASQRLVEAEKEIRRLGSVLKKDREQCSAEINVLEAKLFDPAVTEIEQRRKMEELRNRIVQAEAQKNRCEQDISAMSVHRVSDDTVLAKTLNDVDTSAGAAGYAGGFTSDLDTHGSEGLEGEESYSVYVSPQVFPESLGAVDLAADLKVVPASISLSRTGFMDGAMLGALLHETGVIADGQDPQKVASVSEEDFLVHKWETGEVYGIAEQKFMDTPAQFDFYVTSYLEQAKSRCDADFAALPTQLHSDSGHSFAAYEIACVGSDINLSASVLFSGRDGVFTTIAHETGTGNMDVAMDLRDRLMGAFSSVSGTVSAKAEGIRQDL